MIRIAALILAALALTLAGCQTDQQTLVEVSKYQTTRVPDSIWNMCKSVDPRTLPEPKTLTDLEVARLIVRLVESNNSCYAMKNAARDYLRRAEEIVKSK